MVLHAYNEDGKHMKHGGSTVVCYLTEARKTDHVVDADVWDNEDGTYTCVYVSPSKGSYMLHITVDGVPAAGAPIPVFVGPPDAGFKDHNAKKKEKRKKASDPEVRLPVSTHCGLAHAAAPQ